MKSGTSYFNLTLFRKNLTRYWPIWALYTLIWTYALPITCLMVQQQAWRADTVLERVTSFANGIPNMLEGFGPVMAFLFGILSAMGMFSYLYNNRSACMIHALPVRRESLFLTNYLSGLVCLLGPNCLVWLLTLGAEGLSGYVDLQTISVWLLGQSAMCLFFYSFAVLCAMFTGHLLALPAFYGILNFLAVVLTLLLDVLLEPFLYGYAGLPAGAEEAVYWLTPVVRLVERVRWSNNGFGYRLEGIPELVIYAAAGLVFAGLALLVYRKRHVETAGDVVAVAVVRPIFKYGVALCSGLCFGYWLYAMFGLDSLGGLMGSLLLWTLIGYFVAEMLLKKSFRVLNAWRGCAVLLVLVAVGLGALQMDLMGFSARVPSPGAVASIQVGGMGSYPYDEGRSFEFETQDPAIIETVTALHRAVVNNHKDPQPDQGGYAEYIRLNITYTLTGGTVLRRNYWITLYPDTALTQAAEAFYCDPRVAELAYGLDDIDPNRLANAEVSSLWSTTDNRSEYWRLEDFDLSNTPYPSREAAVLALYDAVRLDFDQGKLGKRYLFDLDSERQLNTCTADLTLYWTSQPEKSQTGSVSVQTEDASYSYVYNHSLTVTLTPQAEHTIRVLTELGVLDEDTVLRLYSEIVDEEERAKFPVGPATNAAALWGYDGEVSYSEAVPEPID